MEALYILTLVLGILMAIDDRSREKEGGKHLWREEAKKRKKESIKRKSIEKSIKPSFMKRVKRLLKFLFS